MKGLLKGIGDALFVLRPKGKAIDDDLQRGIAAVGACVDVIELANGLDSNSKR